jgi:hypothetical protein
MSNSDAPGQPGPVAQPGWVEDIVGMFAPFTSQMMWRLDLGNYEQVAANGMIIYSRIKWGGMPPPPFPPLTDAQIQTFANWMNMDYPMHRPGSQPLQAPVAAAAAPAAKTTAVPPATVGAGNQQQRPIKFP